MSKLWLNCDSKLDTSSDSQPRRIFSDRPRLTSALNRVHGTFSIKKAPLRVLLAC